MRLAALWLALAPFAAPAADSPEPKVEIRRTEYGVPHVLADSLYGAGYGFAYAQAEDHILSIGRLLLAARGEEAKWFGKSELESDFRSRQFRVRERAIETYHRLDADFRELTEGFAAGLNRYIELHRAELPEWIGPVSPHDVAAHGQAGVMRFAFDRGGVIGRFLRSRAKDSAEAADAAKRFAIASAGDAGSDDVRPAPESDSMGSNMFSLAPSRTKSGKALLVGNPHQGWSTVSTYYEAHITVPGTIDFYGSTFIGRPVLTSGFNAHLGWSHTVNYPDLEEIYELELAPDDANAYLFDGGRVAIRAESATVEYLEDGATKAETRTFEHTPLGPVILREPGKIFVLRSACYEEFRFYQQWLRLSQAKNFREFRERLDIQAIPMFNIAYADDAGNIYYIWNGAVPNLPHDDRDAEAVPARRTNDVWTRVHATNELPQLLNPAGGYVQNANSPPYFTNLNEPFDRDAFPAHFPDHRLGLRTIHGLELLHNAKRFSLEEAIDLKFSPRMPLADRVKADLIAAVRASNPNEETARAVDLLAAWDDSVRAASRGSVLFEIWWGRYAGSATNPSPDSFAVPWSPTEPVASPRGLGNPARAVEAFGWAIEETVRRHGAWDVAWGDVHRIRVGKVDVPATGGSGFLGCYRVLDFAKQDDGKLAVRGGDGWIFGVEFGGPAPRAYSVLAYGQSGDPASPHRDDQAVMFAEHRLKTVRFSEEDIRANLLRSYRPGFEK